MKVKDIFNNLNYGPALEENSVAIEWLENKNQTIESFIYGTFHKPKLGKYFETLNPSNGETIAKVALSTKEDLELAIDSAEKGLKKWQQLSNHERSKRIYSLARLIQKNSRKLSVIETLDNGKPIRETRDIDIPLVARHFYYHAGWAQIIDEEFKNYESIGIVGQIIPWNFPLLMLSWKVAPALASGCSIIIKPAEQTSLSAILFAELTLEANIPPGVINILTGDGTTGKLIVNHPKISKIAFTGSTDVGRSIRLATAGSGKSLTLELGGKSPFIVFEDADLDSAVEGVVDSIWFNQGQVCCAGSRLLLQESISDKFLNKLKKRMDNLRIGDPFDKSIDIGAIISKSQVDKIQSIVQESIKDGCTLWESNTPLPKKGYYYPPTVISNVNASSEVTQVEIFGPVLVSMNFRTPKEAVELANNTLYGLAASIWSENINLALDIAPKIKAGVIWINSTNTFDAASGFGGYKESGYGREGGKEGMYSYVKTKDDTITPSNNLNKYKSNKINTDIINKLPSDIDRTAKQFIGGKQKRPDSGYVIGINNYKGQKITDVSDGNRKDIRDAVEAANKSNTWSTLTSHNRAQILFYLAENLNIRSKEFTDRITSMTGASKEVANKEVSLSISRLFLYASWADKYDGNVHSTPMRNVTIAMNEPIGVLGIICPTDYPLLGFISLLAPAISMGNRVVIIPSNSYPLSATDFYQVIETSDLPEGVINIITGENSKLIKTLSEHNAVDGIWYFSSDGMSKEIEAYSCGNMKQTWVNYDKQLDWFDEKHQGKEFLRKSTQVKNIWIPYGE